MLQPSLYGDIRERTIAVVVVHPIGGTGWIAFQQRPAQNEDIEPAVLIVIEEGDPAANSFYDVSLAFRAAVNNRVRKAGLFGDVGELAVEGNAGLFASRRGAGGAR